MGIHSMKLPVPCCFSNPSDIFSKLVLSWGRNLNHISRIFCQIGINNTDLAKIPMWILERNKNHEALEIPLWSRNWVVNASKLGIFRLLCVKWRLLLYKNSTPAPKLVCCYG